MRELQVLHVPLGLALGMFPPSSIRGLCYAAWSGRLGGTGPEANILTTVDQGGVRTSQELQHVPQSLAPVLG